MLKVSVIIPVFNQSALTERCLKSLLEHSQCLDQVIVVDNASQDQTQTVLVSFKERFKAQNIEFKILKNEKNLGFGRACNQGIREALKGFSSFIVILNNDTWLMTGWDSALTSLQIKLNLDCIGPYFFEKPYTETLSEIASRFVKRNKNGFRKHFVPILMCFTRDAILRLSQDDPGTLGGIFDERFFVTYEDTDLLRRMKILKMSFGQTGGCFIWHHSKGTRDTLPSGYEQEGLHLFQEKWGFDPRKQDHTWLARWKRRYWRILEKMGRF